MEHAGWTVENLLKALALAGAAGAFVVSLLQYRKAQRWKRAEWVAQQMKDFLVEPMVQAALQMIDYEDRRILLFPHQEKFENRFLHVADHVVTGALRRHDPSHPFTNVELAIRDAFDCFLDGLERLNSYVGTRLIADDDVRPYLDYWAARILRPDPTDGTIDRFVQLRRYMDLYAYHGATALLERLKEAPRTGLRRLTARWRGRRASP